MGLGVGYARVPVRASPELQDVHHGLCIWSTRVPSLATSFRAYPGPESNNCKSVSAACFSPCASRLRRLRFKHYVSVMTALASASWHVCQGEPEHNEKRANSVKKITAVAARRAEMSLRGAKWQMTSAPQATRRRSAT